MEKIFFSIVRWFLVIILSLIMLLFIGVSIYAVRLYYVSMDTNVKHAIYSPTILSVNTNLIIQQFESKNENEKEKFNKIKSYVISVVEKGSSEHDYPKGDMPAKIIHDHNTTEKIATYIAGELTGNAPDQFAECVVCHGYNGLGMDGQAPNLKKLPIFYGQRVKAVPEIIPTTLPEIEIKSNNKPPKTEFDKIVDNIVAKINEYASFTNQGEVNAEKLKDFLFEQKASFSEEEESQYFSQLENSYDELLKYEKSFAKKDINNTSFHRKSISWIEYLLSFTEDFKASIDEEMQKAQESKMEYQNLLAEKEETAAAARVQLFFVLQVLLGSMIGFIILTMMLVLLKIEINTRNYSLNHKQEESE